LDWKTITPYRVLPSAFVNTKGGMPQETGLRPGDPRWPAHPCCRVSDSRGDVQWRWKQADEAKSLVMRQTLLCCLDHCFSFAADFALAEA
jgi:hypothetical protein